MSDDVKERLRDYLSRDILFRDDSNSLGDDEDLLALMDSASIMMLVSYIEEEFSVALDYHDVEAENLRTLGHVARLVQGKIET